MDGLDDEIFDFNLGEDDTRTWHRRIPDNASSTAETISRGGQVYVSNPGGADFVDPRATDATHADYKQSRFGNANSWSSHSTHTSSSGSKYRYRSSKAGSGSRFSSLSAASYDLGGSATSRSSFKSSADSMSSSWLSSVSKLKQETFPVYNLSRSSLMGFLEERFPGHNFRIRVTGRGYYQFDIPERLTMEEVNKILKLREDGCFEHIPQEKEIMMPKYITHQPPTADPRGGREAIPDEPTTTITLPSDLEYIACLHSKDSDSQTPLSRAAEKGYEAVVKLLLSTDHVNIESKDEYGRTPLSYATENGHVAVVKLLLSTGHVDVESKDKYGRTPLSYATENGHKAVVKRLLSTGYVNVESKDKYGRTPLSQAFKNGHEAIIKLLLSTGHVNIDSKDKYGRTPLSQATKNWHEAFVKLLLANGQTEADKLESSMDNISAARNDSDTDSTCSRDKTDCDNASDIEFLQIEGRDDETGNNMNSFEQGLEQAKFQLVNWLMDEFWTIFNQSWGDGIKSYASGSAPDALPTEGEPTDSAGVSKNVQGSKRGRTTEGDELGGEDTDGDEEGERAPKRVHNGPGPPDDSEKAHDFACPFRKYNPRKYRVSIPCWKSCALTRHKTVARVKAHLYKYHLIYQCTRCKHIFANNLELERHVNSIEGCKVIEREPVDGITKKMEEQLHSRKKAFKGQTEEQRWGQIYDILFSSKPGMRPSPYFEPVRDMEEQEATESPDSTDLANFETFLRRELPLVIQNTLQREVDAEINPVKERLKGKMADWIREATDELFSKYRAMRTTDCGLESTTKTQAGSCSSLDKGEFESDTLVKFFTERTKQSCQEEDDARIVPRESGCDILDSGYTSNELAPELPAPLEKSSHLVGNKLNYNLSQISSFTWKGKGKEIMVDGHHNDDRNEDDHIFSSLDDGKCSEIWGLEFTDYDDKDVESWF